MTQQSKTPRLDSFDWLLEILSVLLVFILFFIPIYLISDLPQEIPIHFNFLGDPDRYGKKETIWVMVVIGFFIYISITVLTFFPALFNYPVKITQENSEIQYKLASRMLRWIKFLTLAGFCYGTMKMVFINSEILTNFWMVLPAIITCLFAVIALFFFKMVKQETVNKTSSS